MSTTKIALTIAGIVVIAVLLLFGYNYQKQVEQTKKDLEELKKLQQEQQSQLEKTKQEVEKAKLEKAEMEKSARQEMQKKVLADEYNQYVKNFEAAAAEFSELQKSWGMAVSGAGSSEAVQQAYAEVKPKLSAIKIKIETVQNYLNTNSQKLTAAGIDSSSIKAGTDTLLTELGEFQKQVDGTSN